MSGPLYSVTALHRAYRRGAVEVRAVDRVDLTIDAGELVAIEGTSGSGKSTLLQLLGGLDRPTSGAVCFDGADLGTMSDSELTALRGRQIGFVFQHFNLIPTLTARQNVEAAMGPLRLRAGDQRHRALELLAQVGLSSRADHLPSTMSGGEQQRVAIARALANGPRVLLADEPTGNLDSVTAADVVRLLRALCQDLGVTVILVTHAADVAAQAPRRIVMRDGRVVGAAEHPAEPPAELPSRGAVVRHLHTAPSRRAAAIIARAAAAVAVTGVGAVALHGSPAAQSSPLTRSAVGRPAHAVAPDAPARARLDQPATQPRAQAKPDPVRVPASAPPSASTHGSHGAASLPTAVTSVPAVGLPAVHLPLPLPKVHLKLPKPVLPRPVVVPPAPVVASSPDPAAASAAVPPWYTPWTAGAGWSPWAPFGQAPTSG